jgi:hypothetical protein
MIRAHSHDRLCGIRDPLEAALFALLIELVKEQDREAGDLRVRPF